MSVSDPGATRPTKARRLLGRSYDAVILDLHDGLDADVLAACQGFVWGGGALVLRMPPAGEAPGGQGRLAVHPYDVEDVGGRMWARLEARVGERPWARRLGPATREVEGSLEQAEAVRRLRALFEGPRPGMMAVLAGRGRGKSSALGMALKGLVGVRVAVTAGRPEAIEQVRAFARGEVVFCPLQELVSGSRAPDVIVVDEAAGVPVPMLQRLVRMHPRARIAFATTTRGYEGTGRGFALRFLAWAQATSRGLECVELEAPIRWSAGDPLERLVFEVLLLDAALAPVTPEHGVLVEYERVCREEMSERDLEEFFGLMVQAHYRTTPSDLHRMLDAPNLTLHLARGQGHVVGATWVAREGELSREVCEGMESGRRVRAHALPETVVTHLGHRVGGGMSWARSVRIAVHPEWRRRGVATGLIEHVHREHEPEAFGTLFGATPGVVAFRRSVGYEVVRVSASRGSRTGEPSVMMMRPVGERASELMREMREELAWDLPAQLALLQADGVWWCEPGLEEMLRFGLGEPGGLGRERRDEIVAAYARGPRTLEASVVALRSWSLEWREVWEDRVGSDLISARVLGGEPWAKVIDASQVETVPAAMRALKRAYREALARAEMMVSEDQMG